MRDFLFDARMVLDSLIKEDLEKLHNRHLPHARQDHFPGVEEMFKLVVMHFACMKVRHLVKDVGGFIGTVPVYYDAK